MEEPQLEQAEFQQGQMAALANAIQALIANQPQPVQDQIFAVLRQMVDLHKTLDEGALSKVFRDGYSHIVNVLRDTEKQQP